MGVSSLSELRALAAASPAQAASYLKHVQANLEAAGEVPEAQAVAQALAATGNLVERVQSLGMIFPETADAWGALQARRAASIGWTAAPQQLAPQRISGRVSVGPDNVLSLTTAGGKSYALAYSTQKESWGIAAQAWVGDGNVSLQGTLGEDGKTFNVEESALNPDGRFDRFTVGRVRVEGDRVQLYCLRGALVDITHPDLIKALKTLPVLYMSLPGEPKQVDGRLVYDQMPPELFALGRPAPVNVVKPIAELPADRLQGIPPPGTATSFGFMEMAHQNLQGAPVTVPPSMESRFNTIWRTWVRGNFVTDANGKPVRFDASYVSHPCEGSAAVNAPVVKDMDPLQAAVLLAEP
jgi:hypothetical protein